MIATLVIGLREGLEATLIVGIIAAFLKRNRIPVWPMWLGVGVAVFLSIAVGVVLNLVEQALPQAQQEGMESIIGAVAVVFVTTMIVWMRKHAKDLKGELEAEASAAASRGTAWALAGMAFLAVLKEGFETSVFLLATFQASSNTALAALGAVIGVAAAVVVGIGLYTGGVRLNLGKFFTGTGIFLVVVAAGLVVTALRTAHEAGWIVIGQQRTVDLSWLVPNGSVRGALLTGVLGIQPDPRVVEVLGWACYLVPVLALAVWPRAWRPSPSRLPRVRAILAASFAALAIVLALVVHPAGADVPQTVAVRAGSGTAQATATTSGDTARLRLAGGGTADVSFPASSHRAATHSGVAAEQWRTTAPLSSAGRPAAVSLDDLVALFGRVPVGISADQQPGPFTAKWAGTVTTSLWTAGSGILDTRRTQTTVLTLSGGGLTSSRTYTVDAAAAAGVAGSAAAGSGTPTWSVPASRVAASAAAVQTAALDAAEFRLWNTWLPLALGVAAVWQAVLLVAGRRRRATSPVFPSHPAPADAAPLAGVEQDEPARSTPYAVR